MLKRSLILLLMAAFALSSTGYAGQKFEVTLPDPPPMPDWMKSPPPIPVPPPPPDIKLNFNDPEHFFYNDKKGQWFYYDEDGEPEFVRGHEYEDDGKHYYQNGKKWNKANSGYAKKKGWKVKEPSKKKKWWKFWK